MAVGKLVGSTVGNGVGDGVGGSVGNSDGPILKLGLMLGDVLPEGSADGCISMVGARVLCSSYFNALEKTGTAQFTTSTAFANAQIFI